MDNLEQRGPFSDIDLVDIWLMIRRYRWLFAGVFVVVLILGLAVAMLMPVKYDYSVAVNVGAIRNGTTGKLEPVLPPDAETAALQNAIIPVVQHAFVTKYPDAGLGKANIGVNTSKDGALVTLTVQGTVSQNAVMREMLAAVVAKMTQDQDTIIQNRIATEKKNLNIQIAKVSSQLDIMQKHYDKVLSNGNQTDKAFTLLLLDDQITSLQHYLFSLQQQLDVSLPNDIYRTQAVSPPQQSLKPSGMGRAAIAAIAVIVAFIMGLIAVFFANLIDVAERRRASVG